MKIPLNAFEQYIDETILKRGLQYFKNGAVTDLEEMAHGEYEAVVEGSENYIVELNIKANYIASYHCTCPYDGEICKHVVAVIFYLQKDILDLSVKKSKSKKGQGVPKKSGKKTIVEQVAEILEKLPTETIKEYIKELIKKDSSFRQIFLADFAYLIMEENKEMYVKKVKAIIKSISRGDYIDYNQARMIGKKIDELLKTAAKHVAMGNYSSAMYISFAVLEELTNVLDYSDDSTGSIGGGIETAIDVLNNIIQKNPSADIRKELFEYCTSAFENKIFSGWNWHYNVIEMAVEIVEENNEIAKLHRLLDTVVSSGNSWDYEYETAMEIRFNLINKTEGLEKGNEFLEGNLNNSTFRKKVIEAAIENKNYSKAIKLSEDGLIKNEKEYPGLKEAWREYLLQIYTLLNDKPNILKFARVLFTNDNSEHKKYFDILKLQVQPNEWDSYLEDIIEEKKKSKSWGVFTFIANIYIWEQQWEKLFQLLKLNPSLTNLENYEQYLRKDYVPQLADFYKTAILDYMKNNMSRDHYKTACNYIRRMFKLGEVQLADIVIKELKTLYPKRKALMEELARL